MLSHTAGFPFHQEIIILILHLSLEAIQRELKKKKKKKKHLSLHRWTWTIHEAVQYWMIIYVGNNHPKSDKNHSILDDNSSMKYSSKSDDKNNPIL